MGAQIVQCANFVTPRSGGLRTAMRHLAEGYAAAGHEVVQIVPARADGRERAPWGEIRYVRAPVLPGSGYRVIAQPGRVIHLLEQLRPHRLEVHDRFTLRGLGRWAWSEDVPSLVISHERLDRLVGRWLPSGPGVRRLVDGSNRGLADGFDTVVCTTDWAAEEFRRLDTRNLVQVPLGVDLLGFHPANYDEELRDRLTPRGEALIVSAVRLSPEKAPMRVVETVRELVLRGRRVRAVVAGDGPLRGKCEKAAADLPITFTGFLSDRGELARLLATADVVVAPGPIETFGLAALEALASGTPVVVDSASALPEVIGAAGFAVPGAPESFAGAVETLLEVSRERARNTARDRAECFPWTATTEGFLAAHRLHAQGAPVGARS